jgi:hypothetical protein
MACQHRLQTHDHVFILTFSKQALANQSVTDFSILEYNDGIGGRMRNTKFGSDANGNPYTVELGAN